MPDFLTPTQLAARIAVCERTLLRWRTEGMGPRFTRLGPRRVAYRVDEVARWLAGRTHETRAAETAQAIAPRPAAP